MIPKTIHYCWFGKKPKPKLAEYCIKSWKKYCPDYEITEWNEENFDISSSPLYVRQAYEAQKWAFVTDYVRLWAMTKFGGIYMDTDVEVIKPLDSFLKNEAFSGFESQILIPTGIMASQKDFPLFVEFLQEYDNIPFVLEDGSFDITTNVTRITNCCSKYGFIPNAEYQVINGFALYPPEFFCPKDFITGTIKTTKNTYAIHHFGASWYTEEQQKQKKQRWKKEKKRLKKVRRQQFIDMVIHIPNYVMRYLLGKETYERIKKVFKGKKADI